VRALLRASILAGAALFPPSTFEGPRGRVLAQLGADSAFADADGLVGAVLLGPRSAAAAPSLAAVLPLAREPGSDAQLLLLGAHVAGSHARVLCRREGQAPDLAVVGSGPVAALRRAPPAGPGREEWVAVRVPRLEEGLHQWEVQAEVGALLSNAAPCLVLADAAAVAELRQLEGEGGGGGAADVGDVAGFVEAVGVVLHHLRAAAAPGAAGNPNAGPAAAARAAALARELAPVAAARGWPALLRRLLPAVALDCAPGAAMEAMRAAHPGGLSILHVAAAGGCADAARALGEWAATAGHTVGLQAAGGQGLTPLHLAALLADGGAMAAALTSVYAQGAVLWFVAEAADGSTPAAFARTADNKGVLAWLTAQPLPAHVAAAALATLAEGEADVASGSTANSMSGQDNAGSVLEGRLLLGSSGAGKPAPAAPLAQQVQQVQDEAPAPSAAARRPAGAAGALRWAVRHVGVLVAAAAAAAGLRVMGAGR
jgi:hypothetical protein